MMPSDSIKLHGFLVAILLCIGLPASAVAQRRTEPFFAVGVRYDAATKSNEQILHELEALRAKGFNAISFAGPPDNTDPPPKTLVDLAARADLEVIDRLSTEYGLVRARGSQTGPEVRLWAWTAMSRGARAIMFAESSEAAAAFARVVAKNPALFAPLRPRPSPTGASPDVRIDGGDQAIEVQFLDSPDVIMMIGLNRSDRAHRVTMMFAPDTQEAIWQNMETGSSVNFVAGPNGPTYTYRFAPHDVFVLMIRRAIR
jgi:hypothetical protein